jgi:hypothetical protein
MSCAHSWDTALFGHSWYTFECVRHNQHFLIQRRAWRYQRGNQNLYIKEEQTTQWPKDTKGVIRICISKKNRQHNGQNRKSTRQTMIYKTHKPVLMLLTISRYIVIFQCTIKRTCRLNIFPCFFSALCVFWIF